MVRSFYRVIKHSYFKLKSFGTVKLAAIIKVLIYDVQYFEFYTNEMKWIMKQSPKISIARDPNALSASKEKSLKY